MKKSKKGGLAPSGTQISPRKNLGIAERGLSLAAGTALGVAASRQKGVVAAALGAAGSLLLARGFTRMSPTKRALGQAPDERAFAKAAGWSTAALVTHSVTINAPRVKVYAMFRDFASWPMFSVNVLKAEPLGKDRWRWTAYDPSGPVTWTASIKDEKKGSLVAIESDPGTPVPINSRWEFRDAPDGRGTEVHGLIAYEPPGGSLSRYASKLTQREPGIQLRSDLKRFKSLIETGEIATNAPQGTAAKA